MESEIEDVTPPLAFPSQPLGSDGLPEHSAVSGMLLRDWFAGHALSGYLGCLGDGSWGRGDDRYIAEDAAMTAYRIADAMMERRARKDA